MNDYDLSYFSSSNTPNRKSSSSNRYRRQAPKRGTGSGNVGNRSTNNRNQRNTRNTQSSRSTNVSRKQTAPANNGQRRTGKKKNRKRSLVFVLIVILVLAIAVTVGIVKFNIDNSNRPFTFSREVTVSGIDISGLTYEQALDKLKENSASLIKEYDIVVKSNGRLFNFDKEDFEYSFEYKKALKQAKLYSLKEQGKIKKTKYADMADEISDDSAFTLNYQVNNQSIEKVVKEVAKGTDKEPKNAKVAKFTPFADNRFEYKNGKDGYKLDRSDLQYELVEFFDKGAVRKTIDARVENVPPEITLEDVKKNIVGLSTATSISSNTADGTHNMKVALEACNGSVINPGEVWSFNDCTGDSNLESNGYRNAAVINNKKIEQGVGGGICQASTTIFKCALFANMAVVERHNHYWASTYAYAGEDATIDYPNLDLRLKNTTDYQMFMECKVEGSTLIVNIYGYQDPSYDNVMLKSENYDIRKGESYRTVTKRYLYLDGEIVKEETVCNSTYSLKDNHIVRIDDEGSFRTTATGQIKYETKPTEPTVATTRPETTEAETEQPTTAKPTEAPTEPEPSETETEVIDEVV